jgi:hypothetical protein
VAALNCTPKACILGRFVALMGVFLLASCAFAQHSPRVLGDCPADANFETQAYVIRDVKLEDPWRFLRAIGAGRDAADKAVAALIGTPFKYAELERVRHVIEDERFLPTDISYSVVSVDSCSDHQLNVIFQVFSAQISPVLSSTFEFHKQERADPKDAAGMSRSDQYVRLVPRGGYDHTDKFFAGGTIEARWGANPIPINAFELEGYGSQSLRFVSTALTGEYDSSTGWLGHADWRIDYKNSSIPTDRSPLNQGRLALQFTSESHPMKSIIVRSGVTVEGGNQQSRFTPEELPPATVASTGYSSIKLYDGITAQLRRQAFAVSYGLQLGSTSTSLHGDWRKQIGDVAYDCWWPFSDHRLVEIEQRFTVGAIQRLRVVPATERFFGGNSADPFVPGNTWQILANPFIRSIPAHRFYVTPEGIGGDQFVSYNFTSAVTVWRRPLVPTEWTNDQDFNKKLNGALVSSTSILEVAYESDDKHFRTALSLLPNVLSGVELLTNRVTAARNGAPSSLQPAFDSCLDALGSSKQYVRHAIADKPVQAYGSVQELLPDGDGALADEVSACGTDLNGSLNDSTIATAATALSALAGNLQTEMASIDQRTATNEASSDMSYVRRTLDTILKEMNIASLSPVLACDVAHLSPGGNAGYEGTRYGVGGGIRFSLVNTASFTLGYSRNPNPRPGEGSGAFFFSFNTRNLFQ